MSATNRSEVRRVNDAYQTDPALALALTRLLVDRGHVTPGGRVLEPSAGQGAFLRASSAILRPQLLYAIDVVDLAWDHWKDFAHASSVSRFEDFDRAGWNLIIGNPPYADARAHVEHALSLLEPGGVLSFLLRLAFLESKSRFDFWQRHPAEAVYVLSERPSFTGGGTDNCAYGWFVWRAGVRPRVTALETISWT